MFEKKYIFRLIVLIFIFYHFNLFSQELLTIEKAMQIGLENNYSILISKNDAEILKNNSGFLPQINFNTSINKSSNDTKQEFRSGLPIDRKGAQSEQTGAGVSLNWTVFDGFNMFTSYRRLREIKEAGEINVIINIESSISQIISTYYQIVKQEKLLKVIRNAVSISEERVKIAEANYSLGSGSKLEILQAKVDLNADKSNLLKQEVVLSNLKTNLNQLLSRDIEIVFSVIDSIRIDSNLVFEDIRKNVLEQNSKIMLAGKNRNIAKLNLGEVKSQLYPKVGINLGYNFSQSESEAGFITSNQNLGINYGVNATVNLFDGFNFNRKYQNAKISIINSDLQYNQIKNQIESDLVKAYKNYENNLQLLKLEAENLEFARQNVNIALERFRLGSITPLTLREAQKTFIDAESRLVTVQYEAKISETELLRLSGQLVKTK
jgi:outer membrane protein TolC